MATIEKILNTIVRISQWVAIIATLTMMTFIFVAVVGRNINYPILGDVEIVEFLMILLIMFALVVTQTKRGHITIGLLVDRFPKKVQLVLDIISLLLICFVSVLVVLIFYQAGMEGVTGNVIRSSLLKIPEFPFKFIISLGFLLWGLYCLFEIVRAVLNIFNNSRNNTPEGVDEK